MLGVKMCSIGQLHSYTPTRLLSLSSEHDTPSSQIFIGCPSIMTKHCDERIKGEYN